MEKKTYLKPELTVVKCRSEAGYSLSDPQSTLQLLFLTDPSSNQYQDTEVFSTHGTWTETNSGDFWD